MINGERAEEKPSSSWDRESDDGDDLSHYSSCGGESEFDRYCSASSAMGTPRFRSGSYRDSDSGSLRSFKLGGDSADFKNLGAGRALVGFRESEHGMSNSNGKVSDLRGDFDVDGDLGNRVLIQNENEGNCGESVGVSDEHSEGDDSMFGCGSDDEEKINSYFGKSLRIHGREDERKENPLVMNSAVAFGTHDWDDFVQECGENTFGSMGTEDGIGSLCFTGSNHVTHSNTIVEGCRDEDGGAILDETNVNTIPSKSTNLDAKGVVDSSNEVDDMDELAGYLGCASGYDLFQTNKDPLENKIPTIEKLEIGERESEVKDEDTATNEAMVIHQSNVLRSKNVDEKSLDFDSHSEPRKNHHHLVQGKVNGSKQTKLFDNGSGLFDSPSFSDTTKRAKTEKNYSSASDQIEDHSVDVKKRDFELNDFYDNEIVNDMEDILLDSGGHPSSSFTLDTRIYPSHFSHPSRDGGSTASTSSTHSAYYSSINGPLKIDKAEIVGASQRKGDVSFSERLVGVQKYTVYKIRVYSGEGHWEVERRYRDFSNLYHRLKKQFSDHGWDLPSPWISVERESRKLFGNASPNVVAYRSLLIQECLNSVIQPKFASSSLNSLVSFLSPSETMPDSPNTSVSDNRSTQVDNVSTLGKTISLVVEIKPLKSVKQLLDGQHFRCAGCRRNFDDGRTRVQELVQALGWGKPRLCEYSGQLFCTSCHNNDTAVLPAKVLHCWDFTQYPVSQMAKSFLDSINDQPMLCVSAVNPFLFSKVPTLQHVANIRSRIRAMLPYVRCPFRRSIYKGLGSRGYLLESNDFFALKDLISLSKGVFSALPVMVETVSRKIQEHITDQCLVCYDVGIPCSARQDCNNPLSLIFPFQEGEVEKCGSCKAVFHKDCFKKLHICPCGARFKHETTRQSSNSNMNSMHKTAETSTGLLADLFSKVTPRRSQILGKQEQKGADNVILMGSFPNTTL